MNDYSNIIKLIKLRSRILFFIFLFIEVFLFFALPSIVYFIIVSLLIYCVYLLLSAKIYSPISDSLEKECDPEKYKQLFFSKVNKRASAVSVMSANFNINYLTGEFDAAIDYANQMISDGRFNVVMSGLSNKAIAEFFKGDYNSLNKTVASYSNKLAEATHLKRNELQLYINNEIRLLLYLAIAEKDTEQIAELSKKLKITNNNTISRVQISFLKALSFYILNDKDSLKEQVEFVKSFGSKTIYSSQLHKFIS